MDEELEEDVWKPKYVYKYADIEEGRNKALELQEADNLDGLMENVRVDNDNIDFDVFVNVRLNPYVIFENEKTGQLIAKDYRSEEVNKHGINLEEEKYEIPIENVSFLESNRVDYVEVDGIKYTYWTNFKDEIKKIDEIEKRKDDQSFFDKLRNKDVGLIPTWDSTEELKNFIPDEKGLEEL